MKVKLQNILRERRGNMNDNSSCVVRDVEFLNRIYQNAKMGGNAIKLVSEKVDEAGLLGDLRTQHEQYSSIASKATDELTKHQSLPKDKNPMSQVGLWSGVQMNTMVDKSPDHIAEMMIQGSMMGVIDMSRNLKRYSDVSQPVKDLGTSLIQIEENNIQRMKQYLC